MKILKLRLQNFQNFEDATFQFNPQFTVLIGDNGTGKSAITRGLCIAAGTFLLGLEEMTQTDKRYIRDEEIRRRFTEDNQPAQYPCAVEAWGELNGNKSLYWKRSVTSASSGTLTKDANSIIEIARNYNQRINYKDERGIDLPVITYFGTGRLWTGPKQTYSLKTGGSLLQKGYARSVDDKSDKVSPLEWIKSNYYQRLEGKTDGALYDAVIEAIGLTVPNWKPTGWSSVSDELVGIRTLPDGTQEENIPLYYLSDGLRIMAAMVAEIAWRCVTLNPHRRRNAVKATKGIILIDELDMHLHPDWQKNVVHDLKAAFPNIQFVATTHSPFIVQSLESSELINLDRITDISPQDLNIETIATEIMGVESPYSTASDQKYQTAKEYLKAIRGDASGKELEHSLRQVDDPALRAFLELNKMAQGK